ncbi:transposase [Prevotella nigrescens]|uniref:transposase n=1 Tax=Prevotella nigrescens TaxID=28133 RepID=UPI0028D29F84|nr:transposase [Prevotella nigrescens]
MRKYEADRNVAYFTVRHELSVQVQRCIYTTNWIEKLNKKYKKTIKMGASMLSDESALFLLASVAMEETTYSRKIHQWKFWR